MKKARPQRIGRITLLGRSQKNGRGRENNFQEEEELRPHRRGKRF